MSKRLQLGRRHVLGCEHHLRRLLHDVTPTLPTCNKSGEQVATVESRLGRRVSEGVFYRKVKWLTTLKGGSGGAGGPPRPPRPSPPRPSPLYLLLDLSNLNPTRQTHGTSTRQEHRAQAHRPANSRTTHAAGQGSPPTHRRPLPRQPYRPTNDTSRHPRRPETPSSSGQAQVCVRGRAPSMRVSEGGV